MELVEPTEAEQLANRIACHFVGNSDISLEEGRQWCRELLSPRGSVIGAASDKHREQMQTLADFCGATVEYKDLGNGENYSLTRGASVLLLAARGNRTDGGYLCISSPNNGSA